MVWMVHWFLHESRIHEGYIHQQNLHQTALGHANGTDCVHKGQILIWYDCGKLDSNIQLWPALHILYAGRMWASRYNITGKACWQFWWPCRRFENCQYNLRERKNGSDRRWSQEMCLGRAYHLEKVTQDLCLPERFWGVWVHLHRRTAAHNGRWAKQDYIKLKLPWMVLQEYCSISCINSYLASKSNPEWADLI